MSVTGPALSDFATAIDARVSGDPILRFLAAGNVRTLFERCMPSAVDLATAAIARSAVGRPAVAFALPRGRTRIPFFVALALLLYNLRPEQREPDDPQLTGSVALATLDLEVREHARSLEASGSPITASIEVHRLGIGGTYVELHSGRRGNLDRRHPCLLLHLPHLRPHLDPGVVSVSVLDAYSMGPDGWDTAFAWNAADCRRQVWIGELGNASFEHFCTENAIPLVRFDWPAIEALVGEDHARCGRGALSSQKLCQRVWYPPRFVVRPVADADVNDLIAELERHFASYHRKATKLRAKGLEEPNVVRSARRLFYFLAGSIAPLSVYEPLALDTPKSFRPAKALRRAREARDSEFHGNWRKLLTEWSAVRHGLSALYDRVKAEHPKFWDLYLLLESERARVPRRRVVLRCATRTEARALELALVDHGAVDPSDFRKGLLEVRWFGVRSGPLDYGPSSSNTLTVLFESPGPNHAGVYLTAEEGKVEALLYPVECQRFRRHAEKTTAHWAASASNIEALAALSWPIQGLASTPPPSPPDIEQVEPFDIHGRGKPKTVELGESVERMQDHWEEYLALEHADDPYSSEETDVTYESTGEGADLRAGRPVAARLLRFKGGDYVYLPIDGTVDVYVAERALPRAVQDVHPGQEILFMEGSERGSAVTQLLEHFDDQYGPAKVYGELWRRALRLALEKAGSETALARMLKPPVTDQTVRNWRAELVLAPKDKGHLNQVIDFSDNQVAQRNRQHIRRYIERVRGAHRVLGRIFNRAIGEQLWEPGGPEQRKLEKMLGNVDLTELFSSVELRSIDWVAAESCCVPTSLLGRTLAHDHPQVRGLTE